MVQDLSNSVVQVLSHPRRDPTKFSFELRPQLLERVVVRLYGGKGRTLAPACSIDSATCAERFGKWASPSVRGRSEVAGSVLSRIMIFL